MVPKKRLTFSLAAWLSTSTDTSAGEEASTSSFVFNTGWGQASPLQSNMKSTFSHRQGTAADSKPSDTYIHYKVKPRIEYIYSIHIQLQY